MAPNVSQLLTKTKTFKLNQSLTCADFGIYVATCVICHEQYVDQTSNKFSKRWSAHRSNWNKQDCKTDSDKDQMALSRHYSENHGTINKPLLHEACTVTFVDQPSCLSRDICENKWYHLIDAQINIQNMMSQFHESVFFLSPLVFLTSVSLLRRYDFELVLRNFDCSLEFVFSLLLLQPFNLSPISFACNFQD